MQVDEGFDGAGRVRKGGSLMVCYGLSAKAPKKNGQHGKIEFDTDSIELYTQVLNIIETCVDATAWRNRVERRTLFTAEAEEIKE